MVVATAGKPSLSYLESFRQWWASSSSSAETNEKIVFSYLPFYPDPSNRFRSGFEQVILSGKDRYINEFHIEPIKASKDVNEHHLVLTHGYGSGIGLYYKTLEPITNHPASSNTHFWCLDWLGMGRSSRPSFSIKARDREGKIIETESFFIDALEEWRKIRQIKSFTLMGHSLGGYLSVAYALKYPDRVQELILVSPVGVPISVSALASDPTSLPVAAEDLPVTPTRRIPGWAKFLWERNLSPFAFVRISGPFGPKLTSLWTVRRFSALSDQEKIAMHNYAYSIFKLRGSGEYALGYLLAPGAYARKPLLMRVHELKCPVTWIYGDEDWMDKEAGVQAAATIREKAKLPSRVIVVKNAGHNVFLDNPIGFADVITPIIDKRSQLDSSNRS